MADIYSFAEYHELYTTNAEFRAFADKARAYFASMRPGRTCYFRRYDPVRREWALRCAIRFIDTGGREQGYWLTDAYDGILRDPE